MVICLLGWPFLLGQVILLLFKSLFLWQPTAGTYKFFHVTVRKKKTDKLSPKCVSSSVLIHRISRMSQVEFFSRWKTCSSVKNSRKFFSPPSKEKVCFACISLIIHEWFCTEIYGKINFLLLSMVMWESYLCFHFSRKAVKCQRLHDIIFIFSIVLVIWKEWIKDSHFKVVSLL